MRVPGPRTGNPTLSRSVAEVEFLQQRSAHDLAVLGAITALPLHLFDTLLAPGHVFLLTLLALGARRYVLHDADEIDRRLAAALVHVGKDHIVLDPALGLGEFQILPPLAREPLGILVAAAV